MEIEISLLLPIKLIDNCGLDLKPNELPNFNSWSTQASRLMTSRTVSGALSTLGWGRSESMPPVDRGMEVSAPSLE